MLQIQFKLTTDLAVRSLAGSFVCREYDTMPADANTAVRPIMIDTYFLSKISAAQ